MIREIHTGNRFTRFVDTALGFPGLHREYIVPDVLDHYLEQPLEVTLHLHGPKENITITCDTPDGSFSFSNVVPDGTTFEVYNSYNSGFKARVNERLIQVPSSFKALKYIPAFAILHEGGHIWRNHDDEWNRRDIEATKLLSTQLFSRAIDGYVWLPDDPVEKEQHLEAWQILGEEERRASAIALYTVGRLRVAGIDPLPQFPTVKSLTDIVNVALKSHEFKFRLRFTESEVENFLSGDLQIPVLGEKVVAYLDRNIEKIGSNHT